MKQEEFNPVLFEEAYDALLDRYSEKCPTRKRQATSAQKRANQAGQMANKAPKPPTPARPKIDKPGPKKEKCPNTAASAMQFSEAVNELKDRIAKTDGSYESIDKEMKALAKAKGVSLEDLHKQFKAKVGMIPDKWYEQNFSEYDFAAKGGRGKPCGGSHISAAYTCRLGEKERSDMTASLVKMGADKAKLGKMNDEQLSRVSKLVKERGLDVEGASRASRAVETLKATQSGGKKKGGDNLQDPEMAKKYADFYKARKDETFTPPRDTSPKEVKAVLDQLKEEMPAKEYSALKSKLASKGTPSPEQKAEWKDKGGSSARGEAVLKSLMDNDFKTAMGEELSWNKDMQLDHKRAGSTGGKDTPSNWIWISSPTNQAKGALEAGATRLPTGEKEGYIRSGLIKALNDNGKMSAQAVADAKNAGSLAQTKKLQAVAAVRDNYPLMSPSQRAQRINDAKGTDLKVMMQGSVSQITNPATGRKPSYRMVKPDNRGGRGAYPRTEEMRSIMRLRWGEKLSPADLKNLGSTLTYYGATGQSARAAKLDELLGNFPPTTGLTAAERIAILSE